MIRRIHVLGLPEHADLGGHLLDVSIVDVVMRLIVPVFKIFENGLHKLLHGHVFVYNLRRRFKIIILQDGHDDVEVVQEPQHLHLPLLAQELRHLDLERLLHLHLHDVSRQVQFKIGRQSATKECVNVSRLIASHINWHRATLECFRVHLVIHEENQ